MIDIHIDFETYSEIDLTEVGVYRYAVHPSTDVLLASYAISDGPIRRWRPGESYPFAGLTNVRFLAWNSNFERIMWLVVLHELHGWPAPLIEDFVCVAAQARLYAASPGKLEVAGQFFQREHKKDRKGHLHMLKMCRPNTALLSPGIVAPSRLHHTPAALDTLHDYCDQDIRTERDVHSILPEWREDDLHAFWENEHINDRGVVVDIPFAGAAVRYADHEKVWFNERLAQITGNIVTTPKQFQRIKEWALPRMTEPAVALTEFYEDGKLKNTFDADTRANLLVEADADAEFMTDDLYEFIDILDQAGKSTISKYENIARRAITTFNPDGLPRVHGLYMFAGAAQTGRMSSVGLQVHNLVRDVPKAANEMMSAFIEGRDVTRYGPPIHTLAKLIRPTFISCPNGDFDLIWGDWSSIEARMLPWLSLHPAADDLLARFRRGEDVYLKTASDILGRQITVADEFERQAYGKVPVLSLGYGGAEGAFQAMARNYGVKLDASVVKPIIPRWREANPWATAFWAQLELAAMNAIRHPGISFSAGRMNYHFDSDALGGLGALFARLPSGRPLCYPDARIDVVRKPWGEDGLGITAMKGAWRPKRGEDSAWPRVSVWYGLLAENCIAENTDVLTQRGWVPIQKVARTDLLWDGIQWVRHAGLVWKSEQICCKVFGVYTTPEHKVLTNDGWRQAGEAQREGFDRASVRLPDSHSASGPERQNADMDLSLRMWDGEDSRRLGSGAGKNALMWLQTRCASNRNGPNTWNDKTPGLLGLAFDARPLQFAFAQGLAQLRRSWNSSVRALGQFRTVLGGYGSNICGGAYIGPPSQRLRIYSWQLPVGNLANARPQHAPQSYCTDTVGTSNRGGSERAKRNQSEYDSLSAREWLVRRKSSYRTAELQPFQVYDLMDAGPLRRFTVRGDDGPLIVHNCTQAAAADLLTLALRKAPFDPWRLEVVLHTHDELVIESDNVERDKPLLQALMITPPPWPGADALPLAADVKSGFRYKVPG